ncbi:MAG: GNAT family N-acetyltransferase [Methylococcaceae bacterium]|nr:GNAT family N-acetyltransferase [Methylococcaceae bacterium]
MRSFCIPHPAGLGLRPTRPSDQGFLESLYRSTREDLRQIDAGEEFIEALIDLQYRAQREGAGDLFPDAMYFIVEYQGERIGRLVLDFGSNEARVVDISLIPAARGKGFGLKVLQAVQTVAAQAMTPVALIARSDHLRAKRAYLDMGFVVEEIQVPFERMVWYPPAP